MNFEQIKKDLEKSRSLKKHKIKDFLRITGLSRSVYYRFKSLNAISASNLMLILKYINEN